MKVCPKRVRTVPTGRRWAAGGAVASILLALVAQFSLVAPAEAAGLPPGSPVVVDPQSGAVGVSLDANLRATVADPDDDQLNVRFDIRKKALTANPADDFTLLVLPDTQNYVSIPANRPIMGAQTQWIVDQRQDLKLAMVAHLGDLAGSYNSGIQFQTASQAMATLDAAGVPNVVVPGNHDMDVQTGAAPLYDQYFPVSRYSEASWNSAAIRYAGYLGGNNFGPDPIDRQNKNSFVLMTKAGMDFLILNLEFNPPDYVIDWAKRVLAAHPTRRAIVVTHNMIGVDNQFSFSVNRPGGNYPNQVWQKLIAPSCSIFLVLNGHNHDGDLGEGRARQLNSCGKPVDMVLSDYQSRVRGGDGWLRYYTFKPSQNKIVARTYSPTLDRYEDDADSAFDIDHDMSLPAAEFSEIGQSTVASSSTASAVAADLSPSTEYEWRVRVSDGTSTTTGPVWTFRTGDGTAHPPAADSFMRSVAAGWGVADHGGAWSVVGRASRYSVANGVGRQQLSAGGTLRSVLEAARLVDSDAQVRLSLDRVPNAAAYLYVGGRRIGADDYSARVKVNPGGSIGLSLTRTNTVIANGSIPSLSVGANEWLRVRVQTEGSHPTVIRAKVWKAGSAEPASWQVTASDATAVLQAAGSPVVASYLSSSATNGPVTMAADDLEVNDLGGEPAPRAPIAAFGYDVSKLQVAFDASASSDPDGTITGYAWSFGDGATSTAIKPTHTFASAGDHSVTLTVTDNSGLSTVLAKVVTTVANSRPSAAFTYEVDGTEVEFDGRTSSDADGTVTSYSWDFGDGQVSSSPNPSHTFVSAGPHTVLLTVTDNDGASDQVSKTITVGSPSTSLAEDGFARTETNGWGQADEGGSWTRYGSANLFSVAAGAGQIRLTAPGAGPKTALQSVSSTDTEVTANATIDKIADGGGAFVSVAARTIGTSDYRAKVKVAANGRLTLYLVRVVNGTETALSSTTLGSQFTYQVGSRLNVRVSATGTNPTTVRARTWISTQAEPLAWQLSTTDAAAGLQGPGGVGVATYLSSSATNYPIVMRFDYLRAVRPQ